MFTAMPSILPDVQLCQLISQPSYTRSFPVLERVLNVKLRSLANFVSKFFALINLSFSNQKTQHDFNQQTQNQALNHLEDLTDFETLGLDKQ